MKNSLLGFAPVVLYFLLVLFANIFGIDAAVVAQFTQNYVLKAPQVFRAYALEQVTKSFVGIVLIAATKLRPFTENKNKIILHFIKIAI